MVSAAEWSVDWCPTDGQMSCTIVYAVWGQSCIDENGFNAIKDHIRDSKNVRTSRCKRWFWPVVKSCMSDMGETKLLVTSRACLLPRVFFSKPAFESQAADPSTKDELYQQITGRNLERP